MKTCAVVHASEIDTIGKYEDFLRQLQLRLERRGLRGVVWFKPLRKVRPHWRSAENVFVIEVYEGKNPFAK